MDNPLQAGSDYEQNPLMPGTGPMPSITAAQAPTPADAYSTNMQASLAWLRHQQTLSATLGLADPGTGLPTKAGIVDAARQVAGGILMGTSAPGEASAAPAALRWYRGTDAADPTIGSRDHLFLTADPNHAASFGKVHQFDVTLSNPVVIDAQDKKYAPLFGQGGWAADDSLHKIAAQFFDKGHDGIILKNWESSGDNLLVRDRSLLNPIRAQTESASPQSDALVAYERRTGIHLTDRQRAAAAGTQGPPTQ